MTHPSSLYDFEVESPYFFYLSDLTYIPLSLYVSLLVFPSNLTHLVCMGSSLRGSFGEEV